jgi:hypothetical protein
VCYDALIDTQVSQYLAGTNIGCHQLQPLTATLSIDPSIDPPPIDPPIEPSIVLSPTYHHPTIVSGTNIASSLKRSLPTVAAMLSWKHNHLITINVAMSFFGTKKGTGILGPLI